MSAQKIPGPATLYFDQPEILKRLGVTGVRCLYKDSRDLIWIGTDNGIYRFDGTNAIYKRHVPGDTLSIPNNTIVSITEDHGGNIWIGTLGGIACMNPYNFSCTVYREELHNLSANFDNKLFVDDDGKIWSGNSGGLFLLDGQKKKFNCCWSDALPGKSVSRYVNAVVAWKRDTLVLGTFNDIVLVNKKNFGYRRITPLQKDMLCTRLTIDQEKRLWIGTWGEGCLVIPEDGKSIQQYKWEKDLPTGVDNIVSSFAETGSRGGDHSMWIASSRRILKIPLQEEKSAIDFSKAVTSPSGEGKSTGDPGEVTCLMKGDENNIWVGGSIVSQFSAGRNLFDFFPFALPGSVQNIQWVSIGGKKEIAVSMWHGTQGLLMTDESGALLHSINSIAPDNQFGACISGLAVDKNQRIWLSSLAGLYLLDKDFRKMEAERGPLNGPGHNKTNDLLINHDTVWVACYKNGIDLYDLNFHKLHHFADNDGSGLLDDLQQKLFRDRKGNVWICGNRYFYRFLPANGKFKKYDFSIEHTPYTPLDVDELPDGTLMIATEIGLVHFNPANEQHEVILSPLLSKEDVVTSVCIDAEGNAWYLTADHLVNYNYTSKKFTLFGVEDGLDPRGLQCIRTGDGKKIWMAQNGRIAVFNPDNWTKKVAPPQLLVQTIQVNDSNFTFDKPVQSLHLTHDHNKIYFEFDGITYTKPEQNQYAYKLQGIDRDWVIGQKNFASYSNLSPGEYVFHVKAANYEGAWSREEMIRIYIEPPYWKTWWFLTASALALAVLFFLVVRYISQRNLREKILRLEKEQAIEKERNRIARDMHDDLGSGLTKIAILSEVAKAQLQKKGEAAAQLESISSSSRELVDNLQDIIWVLNPKNDSLENLSAYIREYALKFFESTGTEVHFHYPAQLPAIKLSEEQRRNIFLVLKESLNNIAKHAQCRDVTVSLVLRPRNMELTIQDNGIGFDPSAIRHFANGLSNMQSRMEQVNGRYEIHSVSGSGTTTRLYMPF